MLAWQRVNIAPVQNQNPLLQKILEVVLSLMALKIKTDFYVTKFVFLIENIFKKIESIKNS